MRLALITFVVLLHSQICAAASTAPIAPDKPAKAIKAADSAKTLQQAGISTTNMKLQPGQEAVRVNAAHATQQTLHQTAQDKPAAKAADETEELSYGTLLATLVLMAAIAVRRLKAGRP